eukprot:2385728-Rhodomonas_salina.1
MMRETHGGEGAAACRERPVRVLAGHVGARELTTWVLSTWVLSTCCTGRRPRSRPSRPCSTRARTRSAVASPSPLRARQRLRVSQREPILRAAVLERGARGPRLRVQGGCSSLSASA